MKPQYKVYREASIFYSTQPFSDVLSFSKTSKPTGWNQLIRKQCFLLPLSFRISLRDTSFYISLKSLGFYLSRLLVGFSWLVYSNIFGKKILIYGVRIPSKCIQSMHFYLCSSPPLKTQGRIVWKSVSTKMQGVEEAMICSFKIQSENKKTT